MKKVTVDMLYECGRCGNVQRRTYESADGLLTMPKVYCGSCAGNNRLSVLTTSFNSVVFDAVDPVEEDTEKIVYPAKGKAKSKKTEAGPPAEEN